MTNINTEEEINPFCDFPKKQEWVKDTHFYTIEVKVGNSWVQHGRGRYYSPIEAHEDAKNFMSDASVSAVKVNEEVIRQVHSTVWLQEVDNVISLPRQFTDTGQKQPCRKCNNIARIASNGAHSFTFCTNEKCKATLPA